MAYLIPENIRNNRSVPNSHRNVASALFVGLNNDVTVWYEPPFALDEQRPDFVILDPTAGITVISVVDGEVLGAVRGKLRVNSSHESDAEDPLKKAISFGERINTAISNRPSLRLVTVRGVAVFPTLTRSEALERGVDTIVAPEQSLFKDDLSTAKTDEEFLLRFLLRVHEGGSGEDLDPDQINELRGVIHPEVVVGPAPEQGSLFTVTAHEPVIKVMDRQQERVARKLGSGHRLIRGVAGSGKTLILLHRARYLARIYPAEPILVTCFTKALASSLAAMLTDFPNIEVSTLHRVMGRTIRDAGLEHPGDKGDWERVGEVALQAVELRKPKPYRAVLIDEAQDFTTDELRFFTKVFATSEPDEQDLLIVADNAQNIFSRKFTWKGAGLSASGRTTVLKTNYRNTRQIIEFAHEFLTDDPLIEIDEDDIEGVSIIPIESSERTGSPVQVALTSDDTSQVEAVVNQVKLWTDSEEPTPRSIAVLMLSETMKQLGQRIADQLVERSIDAHWVGDPADKKAKDSVGSTRSPVVLSTIHSSKGLEFSKVIVTGVRGGTSDDTERRIKDRKTLYVGFTRAVDDLVVIATKDNIFADSLRKQSDSQHAMLEA